MSDLIRRQAAIDKAVPLNLFGREVMMVSVSELENLPSAQPEQTNSWYINSWCNNCKEYDTEKHSCPRFNRVIKQTLDEIYSHAETEAEARFHAEIIACGDCKHWICHDRRCGYWNHGVRVIDWCSHAERRTDE